MVRYRPGGRKMAAVGDGRHHLIALSLLTTGAAGLRLPRVLSHNAVLPRAPTVPLLWGHAGSPGERVSGLLLDADRKTVDSASAVVDADGSWAVAMSPQPPSLGAHTLRVTAPSDPDGVTLEKISFGDVWLCSGQSNMEFQVQMAFNASAEVAAAQRQVRGVRLFHVDHATADEPQPDVPSAGWLSPHDAGALKFFSAVCYMTARRLWAALGGQVPIGLVEAAYGGQRIETFSSPAALNDRSCGGTREPGSVQPLLALDAAERAAVPSEPAVRAALDSPAGAAPNGVLGAARPASSQLWFGMVQPLHRLGLAGVLWYQGEANAAQPEEYACRFPAMIADWRRELRHAPPRANDVASMAFVFVQLAAFKRLDFTALRVAQLAALRLPATGYATAIDLGDERSPWGPIHPRRKEEVGRRLAAVALLLAYGRRDVPASGPVWGRASRFPKQDQFLLHFEAATASGLHAAGTPGCDACCKHSPFEALVAGEAWKRVPFKLDAPNGTAIVRGARGAQALRYAYEAYPQCVIYNGVGGADSHAAFASSPFRIDFTRADDAAAASSSSSSASAQQQYVSSARRYRNRLIVSSG